MPELLDPDEITASLADALEGWEYAENAIRKTWERKGFNGAVQLANVVAYLANQANHHPDIAVHDYKRVTVTLTTHDSGGVTGNDVDLARRIEQAVNA